jgi:hypothetical protein
MSNTGRGNPACPYLGLEDDAETSLAFPSVWNICHRSRRLVSPSLKHQAEHCLGENHRNCTVFPDGQATLPHHLRAAHNRTTRPRRSPFPSLAFVLIAVLVLAGLGWLFLTPGSLSAPVTDIPALTITALMTPPVTPTAVLTQPPTLTMTATPNSMWTGEAASNHQLEQPIGSDYKFVIHRILYGENLNQCASRYNTSIEAIMLVNYDLKTPVWVDTLVIIPVGFSDVSSLPAFQAYEVTRSGTSLKVLALGFGVSLDDLKYYNAIGTDESLEVGEWLLIPRPRLEHGVSQ